MDQRQSMNRSKSRALIIFPGALGDFICLLPAIQALSRRYPEITFELMARADLARLALQRTPITAGHSIDRPEIASLFIENGGDSYPVRSFFGQFERIECFFASDHDQFRNSLKYAAGGLVNFYPFRPPGPGHVAECYLRLLGARVPSPLLYRLDVLPEDIAAAARRLRAVGAEAGRFLLVLPGSGSAKKNWPPEYFLKLAQMIGMGVTAPLRPPVEITNPAPAIYRKSNIQTLVVLGPAEVGLEVIFAKPPLNLLKELELGELAAIARMARCFVGNDSGVSHLAAASGGRGLVIFGPTDPARWQPLGAVRVIRKESLRDLTPELLRPALEELLYEG
jgi:heptosyltransferase-3